MLQWVAEQYATWREQLSAAASAIGPLRHTKGQLLRLLVRKTKHNLLLKVGDFVGRKWSVPMLATLLALAVGAFLLLARSLAGCFPRRKNLQLPTLRMQKGWDCRTLLIEGAKKYPNSPYIITYSGFEYVVFPSSSFDEVKRLSVSRASTIDWFNHTLWQRWAFMGTDNIARYHTVAIDLSRALPSRVWMRQDSAKAAFEAVLGPQDTSKDWKTVSLWKTVQNIVALMYATGLLGPELGTDPRWLKATQRLHRAMMFGIVGSNLTPRILRPLVAPVVFLPAKLVDWHMQSLLRPTVERELKAYEAKEADGGRNCSSDMISKTIHDGGVGTGTEVHRSIREKFPLTEWLLNRYRSAHGRLSRLLRDYIVISFEAAVSSSARLYFMLAELATRPELRRELQDEVKRNTDDSGHLPLSYLAELRKMDSFMLESSRAAGNGHCR